MSLKRALLRLLTLIPPRIPVKYRVSYEFVWVDSFKDPEQMGETRLNELNERQILIKRGLSATETASTIIHEIIHAIDFEYEIGLTERQVLKLEKGIFTFLRLNKLFGG